MCLLGQVHAQRNWDREITEHDVTKDKSKIIICLLKKIMFTRSVELAAKTKKEILSHYLVIGNHKLRKYLQKEWFDVEHMWCNAYRNFFHYGIDTTNISESWFKLRYSSSAVAMM